MSAIVKNKKNNKKMSMAYECHSKILKKCLKKIDGLL